VMTWRPLSISPYAMAEEQRPPSGDGARARSPSTGFASLGGRPASAEPTEEEIAATAASAAATTTATAAATAAAAAVTAAAANKTAAAPEPAPVASASPRTSGGVRPTTANIPGEPIPPSRAARESANPVPAATPPGVGLPRRARASGASTGASAGAVGPDS